MTARAATSADVARRAGVSRTAVSLVLNGRGEGNISEENAERIRRAARELNYVPNAAGVNLRRRSTQTIGLLTDRIAQSPFAGPLIEGARDAAHRRGFITVVADYGGHEDRELEMIRSLQSRQVDAFMHAAMSMREVSVPPAITKPVVLANCFTAGADPAGVLVDERRGGYLAGMAAFEAGHRRVAMLAGHESVPGSPLQSVPATDLRTAGVLDAAREAGVSGVEIIPSGWQIDSGIALGTELLSRPAGERPTAILCARDRVAIGVYLAAARLGLSIPGDVSVIGYDDEQEIADVLLPRLTTVDLPHRLMGEVAMQHLLRHVIDDEPLPAQNVLVQGELRMRDSLGEPAR